MSHKPSDAESNDPEFVRQLDEERSITEKDREQLYIPPREVLAGFLNNLKIDDLHKKLVLENIDEQTIKVDLAYIFRAVERGRPENEIGILIEDLIEEIDSIT